MIAIKLSNCVYFCAIILTIAAITLGQQESFLRKPWPQYSLHNMPKTQFTCHDKILGGYYADPEAQCQMFHVCVKVAGVGVSYVQDFRFLCPNGTAFDQEAQICANWGDVDCDQSVLYYGSDNFDLYRLGSGYESKRAPAAEEDESTFHLQRAESGDIRRFNERRIDQKSRPDQPPNYTKHFETVTRNTVNHIASTNYKEGLKRKSETTKKPIISYYTPTSTTTEHYDESKQEFDDFLKGSHSSNFFVNRNGGREEDYLEHSKKLKPNDFNDFNKKSESTTTIGKSRVSTIKIKRPLQQSSGDFNLITTPTSPKTTKRVTIQAYPNTPSTATTISTTTVKPLQNSFNKINFGSNDYETQAKIQPTTYNPNRLKSTTIKYNELKRDKAAALDSYQNKGNYQNKPISGNSRKVQKFEEALQKSEDFNNFKEFSRAKPQQPQPFKSQKPIKALDDSIKIEPQYQRTRSQSVRGNNQQPAPFSAPQRQTASKTVDFNKTKLAVNNDSKPRGFANRGKINFKASTQYDYYENYRTTTSDQKKFSTLVAKDKYTPTTFKPIKKNEERTFYQAPQPIKPQNLAHKSTNTLVKTNIESTTASPYYNPDEDDGQYHPELYELDYSRNRFNLQRSTSTTGTVTSTTPRPFSTFQNPAIHLKSQQQTSFLKEQEALSDFSDEDDLFKTAQSLNFGAASINKLRADIIKAEKTSQQYNSQYNPHNSYFASPNSTTTSAPRHTSTTINYYTQPATYSSTQTPFKPNAYAENLIFTSTTSIRPSIIAHSSSTTTTTTTTTTTSPRPPPAFYKKSEKSGNGKSSKSKGQSSKKTSKRPPHADEDTSYDYAYYDTDTLSESPQEYQDYEIAEFARTRKN